MEKPTPFFDQAGDSKLALSPAREAKLRAHLNVISSGAHKGTNRTLYALYGHQTVASSATSNPHVDPKMVKVMENEASRVKNPDQVMVMSRVNQTQWKYINQEEHSARMLQALKLENGGREIPSFRKEKYSQKTFNYNED